MRGQGTVYQRGRIWWAQWYSNGVQMRESSHSTRKGDAINLLNRRLTEAPDSPAFQGVTVEKLLDDLIADYRRNGRSGYADFMTRRHARPYWSRFTPEQVTPAKVKVYQDRRLAEGAAPASINRELALLHRALTLGKRSGLVREVPHFDRLRERNIRTGFLEVDWYEHLLAELPEALKLLLVIGYHVGNRRSELLKLQVPQVDLGLREIRLDPGTTKSGRGRVLPIYGDMIPVLTRHLKDLQGNYPGCSWVFHRAGEPIRDFRGAWDAACERAGLSGLLFHDLRRSSVRNMERAGISRSVAMEISGHLTESVYRRYDIVSSRDVKDAGLKLGEYLARAKTKRRVTSISEKKKAG